MDELMETPAESRGTRASGGLILWGGRERQDEGIGYGFRVARGTVITPESDEEMMLVVIRDDRDREITETEQYPKGRELENSV